MNDYRAALKAAREHSKGGKTVFVAEYHDEPGRFAPVPEREYDYDDECGQFFREAVVEFYNGKEVTA